MVEKKFIIPIKPKKSKIVFEPKDIIVSPPKRKTKQIDVKEYFRYVDEKVRKHKRTVRSK